MIPMSCVVLAPGGRPGHRVALLTSGMTHEALNLRRVPNPLQQHRQNVHYWCSNTAVTAMNGGGTVTFMAGRSATAPPTNPAAPLFTASATLGV